MADGQAQIVLSAVDRTRAAFESVKRNLAGVQGVATTIGATVGPLLGTVGLLGGALSALSFKRLIDGVDALNDLKDATGASIENLSALEDVADRNGTALETVGAALTKLNRDLAQANPGSQTAETLKAIGLNAQELRRLDPAEALLRVAKALDGYADSGSKARLIQALFGKSVQEVGPFLKDLAEKGELNAKVTTQQAEEAEKFNKQLFALQTNLKDAARELAGPLLTSLNETIAAFRQGAAEGKSFLQVYKELSIAKFGDVLGLPKTSDAERLKQINSLLYDGFQTQEVQLELERERAELQERMAAAQAKAAAEPPKPAAAATTKPQAPEVPDLEAGKRAAAEALANLRRIVDGNVKEIESGLQAAQNELRFNEQASRQLYSLGVQSLEQFFDDQDRARQENLQRLREATQAEIAERQKLLASPLLRGADKAAERQEVSNQIAEAQRKLRDAEREADQQASLGARERAAAVQALRDQVADLDAQIRDLATGGDQFLTDGARITQQIRAAQQLLVQSGADPQDAAARAARFGELLEAQRQFNIARQQFSTITADAAREEERLLIAARRNGLGLLETEDAVSAARQKALGELEKLIGQTSKLLALSPQNTALQQYLADLQLQADRLREAMDVRKLRLDEAADDGARTLVDGLRQATIEGGNLRDIIGDVGKRINSIVLDEAIFKPLQEGLANFIKGAGGKGLGQNLLSFLIPTSSTSVAGAVTGFGGGTLADAAGGAVGAAGQAAAQATTAATISAAITAASASETAALTAAITTASGTETAALTTALTAGFTTSSTAIAAAISASSAASTAAIVAAISTSSAVSGAGGASSFASILGGFDEGGFTGNVGDSNVAGVVHGGEFVFSAAATRRIGADVLDKLHRAARNGAPQITVPGFARGGYVDQLPRGVPGFASGGAVAPARSAPGSQARIVEVNSPVTFVLPAGAQVDKRTLNQAAARHGRMLRDQITRGTAG